ncbi:tetratricopeptide repeat protein [Psychroserpens sp. SPM9]|uniref:transcriptional regulator n=1 Tax=Psychroserpens sp. SPM9 TaxID=2975598 RepID=UPI0021A5E1D9|nr:tetratricopeptide repeat protein [Psychroserpens sp. SPM9]MDG5491292.1 tetratricopeptide repeat protein [Psychroserpens sp. SPM9]
MKTLIIALLFIAIPPQKSQEQCKKLIQLGVDALNRQEYTKSLEILIDVQAIASSNGWQEELFFALNNIGANYYQLSDYGEALNHYLQAYDVAVNYLNDQKEMVVLNNVGILYFNDENYEEAKTYFLKAFQIASKTNETDKIGLYAVNLGLTLNLLGDLDKAHEYLEMTQNHVSDKDLQLQAQYAIAENLYLKTNYNESADVLTHIISDLKAHRLFEHVSGSFLLLSQISLKNNDLIAALDYALKAKNNYTSIESSIDIFDQLSDIKYRLNEFSEARTYKDSVLFFKDSLFKKIREDQFESSRVKFDIKRYENEIIEEQIKLKQERKTFYVILIAIALMILTSLWSLKTYSTKAKQKRIISERNQKIKMLELENELETNNRKLTSKALNTASRNELLQEIIQTISSYPDLLNNTNLKKLVQQLKKHLNDHSGWQDFLFHFEKANYGFLKALKEKHPSLNTNDIRFICYLYMDLSTKEIASIFNITADACRKRKQRVAKKMDLQDTSKIYDYLSGF